MQDIRNSDWLGEISKDSKWASIPYYWLRTLNVIKMSFLSRLIYRLDLNFILNFIHGGGVLESSEVILECMCMNKKCIIGF
jgi:hypothetical protein